MPRRWVAVLLGLIFVLNPSAVMACSCVRFTKAQMVENAALIFTGTVTGVTYGLYGLGCSVSSNDPASVIFTVETVYKGDAPARVTVTTASSGASCGYQFAMGKHYTVFATGPMDHVETNLCRGNVEGAIDPAAYGLGAGRPPR